MGEGADTPAAADRTRRSARRFAGVASLGLLAILLVCVLIVWLTRERIAENIIADQIAQYDLPASYDIESIGPSRQVLTNIVIGDPTAPDLTIERVEVALKYRFGFPAIGQVTLLRPRLYGEIGDDGLSFGSFDNVLFAESDQPPGLPQLDLKLVDGRARIDSDYGSVGIKAEGEGDLSDGFAGVLAAVAPRLAFSDCVVSEATLYGELKVEAGKPGFDGPVRMAGLGCTGAGIALARSAVQVAATGDANLKGGDLSVSGELGSPDFTFASAESGAVNARVTYRDGRIVAQQELDLLALNAGNVAFGEIAVSGALRSDDSLSQFQSEWDVEGQGLALGDDLSRQLADARAASEGSLLEPLLARLQQGLAREVDGGTMAADLTLRRSEGAISAVAPRISLRGPSGDVVAAISRLQLSFEGDGLPRLAGNISTGGVDIPRLTGRMERSGAGQTAFRLQLAPYAAGDSRVAMPELSVTQSPSGALTFAGNLLADGPLPGGEARGLAIPIEGGLATSGGLRMWQGCTPVRFQRLSYYELSLSRQQVTLCPLSGRSILETTASGLQIAAGAPSLKIEGELAGTPLSLASGPVGFAWPGTMVARDLDIVLGPPENAARFAITDLAADLGEDIAGTFAEADVRLDAVPLDIFDASGNWSYRDGILALADGAFRLEDRNTQDLFNPLLARGASLTLADNRIRAEGVLREPGSDRVVTEVTLRHDLSSGAGDADMLVSQLRFDSGMQPVDLTKLALGVIANAEGSFDGTGRIRWDEDDIISSGEFTTEDFDFAAAFGPVAGARGTIRFTDLLSLTTAPDQRLFLESINPGIEVNQGEVRYQLTDGEVLEVMGGEWPWLGGTLTMRPVTLNLSQAEIRRYTFEVVGLDAALFIERLELANIAARGTFDGTIAVVFDELGNGFIEDGVLIARPPGGNLSYVGELTYEDMGTVANFAFSALRSLDFRQMSVGVDGPLTGDILTKIRFEGVSQGQGTTSNFITRRLAKLPIRFNVNIRAPFYKLLTEIRAIYDPAFVRDPRDLGLVTDDGTSFQRQEQTAGEEAKEQMPEMSGNQPPIQDPESEDRP